MNTMGCKGLSRTLFDLMSWEDEGDYKFRGQFITQNGQKLLLFELDEPVIIKKVEQVVVPEQPEEKEEGTEEIVITETVRVYPPAWTLSFGEPLSVLEQRHYSGDWDVLRPAKELEEMNIFTAEKLNELMKEAETIMERWEKSA